MEQKEIEGTIEQLGARLKQRHSQLLSQDAIAQRIVGQIEAYQTMVDPEVVGSSNGELIEETE